MQEKAVVIILRKGKEMLVFPGPGGYKIEWAPGAKILPMTSAPSEHLVVPCDHYDKASKVKHDDHLVFMTDHTNG
eukprot:11175184-Lingulodinium_polyedra.AAC.1